MLQEACSVCSDVSVLKRLSFAAINLQRDMPRYWELVRDFGFKSSSVKPAIEKIKLLLENIEYLDREASTSDKDMQKELQAVEGFQGHPLGIVLMSKKHTCDKCNGNLLIRADRPSFPVVYSHDLGTICGTHFRKYCSNSSKGCSFTQHYGFHSYGINSEVYYDKDCFDLPYFMSTSMTVFETKLLDHLTAEVLLGQLSYKQKADIYNYTHHYHSGLKKEGNLAFSHLERAAARGLLSRVRKSAVAKEVLAIWCFVCSSTQDLDRQCLDRRRLEEAHLKFCILDVFRRYPDIFAKFSVNTSLKATLDIVSPVYYEAFTNKYAEHKCSYPGCKTVLIIDGNMKNRRDVCAASEAGFVEYEGLPMIVKTGCQHSPLQMSKYCYSHTPRIQGSTSAENLPEEILKLITAKKQTRGVTYYQVAWLGPEEKITWEPASSLKQELVDDYERGVVNTESESSYGVISHQVTEVQPGPKRRKYDEHGKPCVSSNHGSDIQCNTDKDRIKTHNRTAGILAGMKPCGVIVLLAELFITESISQVYASLHEYFRKHVATSKNLEFICYDDGCHLRKYARNSSRCDLSVVAQQLASIEIVVDKLHFKGHTDRWCLANCNPNDFAQLKNVDTEVCEQIFSWLSRYGFMTRRMNRCTFIFFLLYISDLHNERELIKLRNSNYI